MEYNETFNLIITEDSLPKNITLGEINTTEVTIVNNGSPGEYTVNLFVCVCYPISVSFNEFLRIFCIYDEICATIP